MTEQKIVPTEAGQKAAEAALEVIKGRSYSGRNPELGRMINCPFCDMRHRENDTLMKCEQKFLTELAPPEGLAQLTARQIFGALAFNRRRRTPRNKPKAPVSYWRRILIAAAKRKDANTGAGSETPDS